jgi:hypothetical protein
MQNYNLAWFYEYKSWFLTLMKGHKEDVKFEVLMVVSLKNVVFWKVHFYPENGDRKHGTSH